jgi:hypothetical protein
MRKNYSSWLLMTCLLLTMAGAAMAFELGTRAPAKPADNSAYVAPEEVRQGGDTIAEAIPITIPGTFVGTTTGYNANYDEMCPYGGNAPDVVYSVTPATGVAMDFDLCYSSYDTKIFIYDEVMNLIACNDDFHFDSPCFDYSSKLENVALQGGTTYYIIVTGYSNANGPYQLDITEYIPCVLDCPVGAQLENEPPLEDGYQDAFNGGCNSPEFDHPFQAITAPIFCGVTGWYHSSSGLEQRDTDWFHIVIPAGGVLEITGDAEFATYMFELAPQDCENVAVAQDVIIGPCQEATMTITGEPGSLVWFWAGPTTFSPPANYQDNEYNYVLYLNLEEPVATERQSWTSVKSLFH